MRQLARLLAVAAALAAGALLRRARPCGRNAKTHRIAFQVDQNDPAVMNLVLNNVSNLMEYYHGKGEQVQIEVVAYGPGLQHAARGQIAGEGPLEAHRERHLSVEREVFRLRQHQEGHGEGAKATDSHRARRRRSCRPASCA